MDGKDKKVARGGGGGRRVAGGVGRFGVELCCVCKVPAISGR